MIKGRGNNIWLIEGEIDGVSMHDHDDRHHHVSTDNRTSHRHHQEEEEEEEEKAGRASSLHHHEELEKETGVVIWNQAKQSIKVYEWIATVAAVEEEEEDDDDIGQEGKGAMYRELVSRDT